MFRNARYANANLTLPRPAFRECDSGAKHLEQGVGYWLADHLRSDIRGTHAA